MKITPNIISSSIYKLNSTVKSSPSVSNYQPKVETNALECLSNYNVPFGKKRVYAFEYDGTRTELKSVTEAEKLYGSTVPHILKGKGQLLRGVTFVFAKDIEKPDGSIDPKALEKVMKNFQRADEQPIYSIDFQGNWKRFENRNALVTELGVNEANLSMVLNGKRELSSGYMFVKAFDVEKRDSAFKLICDEKGNPVVDQKVINKARENFLHTAHNFPIARVGQMGDVTVFESISSLVKKTNVNKSNVYNSINSQRITSGYSYARLEDLVAKDKEDNVLFNEDGTYMIDPQKLNNHIKRAFKIKKS